MILFTILALIVTIAAAIAMVLAGIFGVAAIVVFGDIIVCALILWAIIKLIFRKKKK